MENYLFLIGDLKMSERTRTTGYTTSTTEEQLAKVSKEMGIMEGGKNFQAVTPLDINSTIDGIFEDSQDQEGGLQFVASHEIGSPLIAFKRKAVERIGGNGQPLKDDSRPDSITETGIWSHYGKGNSKYTADIPIEILKQINGEFIPEICDGSNGNYVLTISGSTDQTIAQSASLKTVNPNCLNGMTSEIIMGSGVTKHRNTKGLNIRELYIEAIRLASTYYHKFNSVTEVLRNTDVSTEQLGVFFLSALKNNIINGGNVNEIYDYFMDANQTNNQKYNSWFDNNDMTAYRLYQCATLWGERQNSLDKRRKISNGVWWSLADSGIYPLPDSCSYPSGFKPIKANPEKVIIDISANENVAVAV